jgi:hypothetical protein
MAIYHTRDDGVGRQVDVVPVAVSVPVPKYPKVGIGIGNGIGIEWLFGNKCATIHVLWDRNMKSRRGSNG